MVEALIQVLIGVASTVLGALIVARIPLATRPERYTPARKAVVARNVSGVQVITGDISGSANFDIDNSRQIVVQNIQASLPASSQGGKSSDSSDSLWLILLAAVLAAGLFLFLRVPLFWFSMGVCLGLVVALVVAVLR